MNNITRVYKEATSCTETKKKLTFTAHMSMKPQEECIEEIFENVFAE
jgi:nitric oxide synthase oxygenase domain/subunit